MDVFWIPLLITLVLLLQTTSTSNPTEVIEVLGRSVTFQSPNPDGKPALWSFGNDPIVTVVFEHPPKCIFLNNKFKTRFAVSENGRALTISPLRLEDAGTYSVTIEGKRSTFTLQVFRELAVPTVTCEAQNCSDGSCSSSLRCSAPGADVGNVSYTWRVGDHTWDGSSLVLRVNETSQDEPEPVTCMAQNPISSKNVTVTISRVLCAGTHSSSQLGVGRRFWVLAGILVAASLSIFFSLLWKSRGWTKCQSKPADTAAGATNDYMTVYAEVGQTQQRVPDGTKAKPAAGEPATTVYSLVNHPDQVHGGTAENAPMAGLELV